MAEFFVFWTLEDDLEMTSQYEHKVVVSDSVQEAVDSLNKLEGFIYVWDMESGEKFEVVATAQPIE